MCTVMLASNVNLPVYAREIQEVDVIEAQVNATETITLNKVIYKNYGTYYTVSGFEDGITQAADCLKEVVICWRQFTCHKL